MYQEKSNLPSQQLLYFPIFPFASIVQLQHSYLEKSYLETSRRKHPPAHHRASTFWFDAPWHPFAWLLDLQSWPITIHLIVFGIICLRMENCFYWRWSAGGATVGFGTGALMGFPDGILTAASIWRNWSLGLYGPLELNRNLTHACKSERICKTLLCWCNAHRGRYLDRDQYVLSGSPFSTPTGALQQKDNKMIKSPQRHGPEKDKKGKECWRVMQTDKQAEKKKIEREIERE